MGIHERWLDERHHEHYYKLAKKTGYRSRASYKIMQIDDRFGIFKEGDSVVDLGASPGGWLQVAKERVGENGKVIVVVSSLMDQNKLNALLSKHKVRKLGETPLFFEKLEVLEIIP